MQLEIDWLTVSSGKPTLARLSYYDDAMGGQMRGHVFKAWKFYLKLVWKTD